METKKSALYLGMAGQFAVMAEIAARGYNVAQPAIDIGDDIFVIKDSTGNLHRIQVKTYTAGVSTKSYTAYPHIDKKQLLADVSPELYYVFVFRIPNKWEFVIIPRSVLKAYYVGKQIGTDVADGSRVQINLKINKDTRSLTSTSRTKGTLEITQFLGNWDTWPVLD